MDEKLKQEFDKMIDEICKEHGDETFISSGYAPNEDLWQGYKKMMEQSRLATLTEIEGVIEGLSVMGIPDDTPSELQSKAYREALSDLSLKIKALKIK